MLMKNSQGQATSELLVMLAVFVPLVLGLVLVANMLHVQTTAHKAARYMAWESTAYSAEDYRTKLNSDIMSDINNRFLDNDGVGFGQNSVGSARKWIDHSTGQDIVNMELGARHDEPTPQDFAQNVMRGFMTNRTQNLVWVDQRTELNLDTENIGYLSIPYDTDNISLLRDYEFVDPKVQASFAIVSDSWSAASESQFTEIVKEVRSPSVVAAHRLHQRAMSAITGILFKDFRNTMYHVDDPYEMVYDQQSTILPTSLPAYDEGAGAE